MDKLDQKRPTMAPLLQSLLDPQMKDILEKYVPLYELKWQSKIGGLKIGLEQVAAKHKR